MTGEWTGGLLIAFTLLAISFCTYVLFTKRPTR